MAIQYSGGTYINTSFTNTTGTRREIVDGVSAALASAGWTYKSGQGTGDVVMLSAQTPSGNQMAVRCQDPGSGNCAKFYLQNSTGTAVQTGGCYLFPQALKVWKVIASKYQFFVFVLGSTNTREFLMGSAIYVPSFLQSYEITAALLVGQSKSDTDTGTGGGFLRNLFVASHNNYGYQQNAGYLFNNGIWEVNNINAATSYGAAQMVVPMPIWGQAPSKYTDNSLYLLDPLVGWGTASVTDEPTIKGQLWDSLVVCDYLPLDSTYTFDGRTFWNLTSNLVSAHSFLILVP